MNKNHLFLAAFAAIAIASAGALHAQTVATDTFETGTFPNTGTGTWTEAWTPSGPGGQFLDATGQVSGSNSMGLFSGTADNTETSTRTFTPITQGHVTVTWSLKDGVGLPDANNEMGFSVLDGSLNPLVTLAFINGSTNNQLEINDGGSNFQVGNGPTFVVGDIYDFSLTFKPNSNVYSFTATDASGAGGSDSAMNFNAHSTPTSIGGVEDIVNLPSGVGNNTYLDNVVVTVAPEPGTLALTSFGAICLLGALRRKR